MTDTEAMRVKAREMASQASRLTAVPWEPITDARKDEEFCCRGVSYVLRPATGRDTGIVIIATGTLLGYSPNGGLTMAAAAGSLLDLVNDPGVADDLGRLKGAA